MDLSLLKLATSDLLALIPVDIWNQFLNQILEGNTDYSNLELNK